MRIEHLYLVWVILCAAAGALIGAKSGHGILRGVSDGMFVAFLPLFLWMIVYWLMSSWRPLLPPCRCGKSRRQGYRHVGPEMSGRPGRCFRCHACGRLYESHDGRFDEVTDTGCIVPYMHHSRWGRWKRCAAENLPPP